ncbi:MAG: Rod shape-determining protein RodA [Deltaproteobacteria bacterium ADurb.BinA179]|jgi:rod shape determining protein RodA|nr:rod shape-determining protein RodA [Pseudomonadota bacterium]NLW67751.1 rod shape-determining protein RodA [Bacteriovoracaceae bacterium]OPZ30014.1 MAG: Rod shape-determining protein RodA [Deltaproteobacteria bacterium ADurb.BinA179]HNU74682.1 rod shape-determining protein RodA [Deltaproteobacteria bacterium]HRR20310.1 rod shape-determining protein RodA [Desulfomonilia bacterium]
MSRYARITDNIDWGLISTVIGIIFIGLLCLYSSSRVTNIAIFYKQLTWILISVLAMIVAFIVDYRVLLRSAWPLYILMVSGLILVLIIGREISGARRWLSLGPLGIQPSELAKVIVIIWLAYWGEQKKHIQGYGIRELVTPALFIFIPVGLILIEPDLGTAGIVALISCTLLLLLGIKRSTFISLLVLALSGMPFVWYSLKDYQRLRIISFLDPSRDPLGSGYHAMQSKIAVGSGGLLGKGFLEGTQTQLRFLPEHHTDFIFSVVAEEWGFAGSALLLLLYVTLVTKIMQIGFKAKDRFGTMICFGIAAYFTLHLFINIAMAIGIFPVVGVPLPFISYGGSFMLINWICIGLVLNISWRRFIF